MYYHYEVERGCPLLGGDKCTITMRHVINIRGEILRLPLYGSLYMVAFFI